MTRSLILPHYFLTPFFLNHQCQHCGAVMTHVTLRYPKITHEPPNIILGFPTQCSCGRGNHVKVELPMLLFGHLLARETLLHAGDKFCRSAATLSFKPQPSDLLEKLVAEYEQLLVKTVEQASHIVVPGKEEETIAIENTRAADLVDRLRFGLNPDEWAKFRRRMGLGPGQPDGPENS